MVAIAGVATNWLARMQIPLLVGGFLHSIASTSLVFWMLYIVFLMIIGMFLEQVAAIIMIVPVFLPIAALYQISPLQFGLVTVVTLAAGLVSPPVGLCVYVASGIAKRNVEGGVLPLASVFAAHRFGHFHAGAVSRFVPLGSQDGRVQHRLAGF